MTLVSGTRLGPYEIVSPLGAGGMGEVYRARDTKLNRDVALKILPEAFTSDGDRLARFRREAQVLASLNHPNIAAIYGFEDSLSTGSGQAGATHALVMELVEGEDLSAPIARGAMPLAEALPIAKQIADALEAAHEQGIIHRDLKPANVKLRPDGAVKVLDFGLAKAMDANPSVSTDAMNSPTLTARATAIGMIIGTAAYMSPEQAKGRAVDRRADIWAFGVVLFEMLTGQRAFKGDDVSETLASVLKDAPDLKALPVSTPPRVRALIERCLDRDVRQRLRDIGEARILLSNPIEPAVSVGAPPASSRPSWIAAAGGLALAGIAAATAWYAKPVPVIPLRRIELPAAMAATFTPQRMMAASQRPTLSLDGTSVAWVDGGHLWLRALETVDPRDLGAVPADTHALAWSPDSRSIAFAAEQTLRTIPAAGGPAFVVCRIPASGRLMGLAWQPDGQLVAAVWRDSLYSVRATGGEPVVRLAVDAAKEVDFHEVSLAPNGGLIVSTHIRSSTDVRIELLRGARRTILWDGTGVTRIAYASPDMAVFQRAAPNAGVWAVPWTEGRLDLGAATLVAAGAVGFSVSDDGALLYGQPAPQPRSWAWVDRAGGITPTPGLALTLVSTEALSPDGRRVVFVVRKGGANGIADIFVRDLGTGSDTQLTFTKPGTTGTKGSPSSVDPADAVRSPNWFPSGDRVLYGAGGVESTSLVSERADRAEAPRPFAPGISGAVSRDGRILLALVDDRGARHLRRSAIAADGAVGPQQTVLAGAKDPNVSAFDLSFDGRLLAYATRDADSPSRVFLTGFPDDQWQVPVDENGRDPHFSPDGRELLYVKVGTDRSGQVTESLVSVPIVATNPAKIGTLTAIYTPKPGGPSLEGFDVAPDGRRFLLRVPIALPTGEGPKLIYVQNWRAGLKK